MFIVRGFLSSSCSVVSNIARDTARQMVRPLSAQLSPTGCRYLLDQQQRIIWHFSTEFYGKTGESGHIFKKKGKIEFVTFREAVQKAAVWLLVPGVAFSYSTCHSLLYSQICLFEVQKWYIKLFFIMWYVLKLYICAGHSSQVKV